MDVTCDRCATAYEFDDALVSERGTTVKCTNCGHQFKVRRATASATPERWLVRTIDGRELEFRALRELQGAIAQAQISREDVLSRGGSRPRRLGSIAELEPFFASVGFQSGRGTSPGIGTARARIPTPQGLGAVNGLSTTQRTEGSVAIPLPKAPPAAPGTDFDLNDETVVMPGKGARQPSPAQAPRPRSVPPPPVQTTSSPKIRHDGAASPRPRVASEPVQLPGVIVSAAGAPSPSLARVPKDVPLPPPTP